MKLVSTRARVRPVAALIAAAAVALALAAASPVPAATDTDGDGTQDASDLLPTVPGPATNRGAPVEDNRRAGDFNGDGRDDLAVFYDYGNSNTAVWTFRGSRKGLKPPTTSWTSGDGAWTWSLTKPVAGDFDGDGRDDIAAFYDFGGADTGIRVFKGSRTGLKPPRTKWRSGPGNWSWDRTKPVAGDFNGDGRDDIAAFYDYGDANTAVWIFRGSRTGLKPPTTKWTSAAGAWNWALASPVVGNFAGDERDDIAAFYDFGGADTALRIFQGTRRGLKAPTTKWRTGPGQWGWDRTKPVAGDFNGDRRDDIAAFYDYGNSDTAVWVFRGARTGIKTPPTTKWTSADGAWNAAVTKPVSGDFNGDGRVDIAAVYDFGSVETGVRVFKGSRTGLRPPATRWRSGPGQWSWAATLAN